MKLSVILLTWNSVKHIEKCLESIYNNICCIDFEVILVDNGSNDNTLEIVFKKFPKVIVIENANNRGVAPARNQGICVSRGEYILLLDTDAQLCTDVIDKLLETIEQNNNVGICGPRLIFPDGTVQNSCRKFPLLFTKFIRRIDFKWVQRFLKNEYYVEKMKFQSSFYVDYVIGACQMLRRRALEEVGILDDKIFYGPEDVDLCLRMWLKGWKVLYTQSASVIHYEQRITKAKFFSKLTFIHIKGLIYYFVKHRYCFSRKGLYKSINS